MTKLEISVNLGENLYDPQAFVDATVYAEKLGFRTAWFGDHIFPWFHSGKRSSFCWSVMSVALEKTDRIKVGPWVTVPIGARYHPAIIAQASATLDNMYPGRVLLGVGTGEALNEAPFWNGRWPKWREIIDRLIEGIRLIRQMWNSKEPFKFEGKFFTSDFYYLYTKPRRNIPIYVSAIGRNTAKVAGLYGDGLITVSPRNNPERLKDIILPAYTEGRKESNKPGRGKVAIEIGFSFDTPEKILRTQWRTLGFFRKDSWSIPNPVAVEAEGKNVTVSDIKDGMHLCKSWKDVVKVIETYKEVGVNEVAIVTLSDKKMIRQAANNILSVF